nr:single-pass membrane and coiled-coil domain-containing protein 4 isoform X1 [Saimiri boliviensis boliviensis]
MRLPGGRGRLALRSGAPEPPARAPRGEARRGARAAAATATSSRQRRRRPRAGITQVTCTENQFAEIIQATILDVEEKEVPALTSVALPGIPLDTPS